jgi:hypothetical protein
VEFPVFSALLALALCPWLWMVSTTLHYPLFGDPTIWRLLLLVEVLVPMVLGPRSILACHMVVEAEK